MSEYVMVSEITKEMVDAGARALPRPTRVCSSYGEGSWTESRPWSENNAAAKAVFEAMLAAAPTPPAGEALTFLADYYEKKADRMTAILLRDGHVGGVINTAEVVKILAEALATQPAAAAPREPAPAVACPNCRTEGDDWACMRCGHQSKLAAAPPIEATPWQYQVADALDTFWNVALGAAQEYQDATANAVMSGMVQGFSAMAARLREFADKEKPNG